MHLVQPINNFVEAFLGRRMLHRIMFLYLPWWRFGIRTRIGTARLFGWQRFQRRWRRLRRRWSPFAGHWTYASNIIVKLVNLFVVHLFFLNLLLIAVVLNRWNAAVNLRCVRWQFIVIGSNSTGEFRHLNIAFRSQPLEFRPDEHLGIIGRWGYLENIF